MPQHEEACRAFVGGATGYTGRNVVQELVQANALTHAHIRPGSSSRQQWVQHFESLGAIVSSATWDNNAMRETLRRIQPTHVFSLLGTTRAKASADKSGASTYEAVDYNLTAMLLDAALATGISPCFTFLSSLGATASTGNQYLKVRGRLEDLIKASGLPWLIVQPAIITGPDRGERRLLELASAKALDGLLMLGAVFGAKRLQARYSLMSGGVLARGIVHFALNRSHEPGTGRTITYEDIRGTVIPST